MIRTLLLSGAMLIGASSTLVAQEETVRWNDRPDISWDDQAPLVRVAIEGNRGYGGPLRVRFQVSDNAYVTVAHVDGDGRLTILFPESRNQRSAVRANQVYYARNQRLGGDFSFVANGTFGGYVFALASYSPLDFGSFENRDFDRIGGWSEFTVANRSIARRPDVLIDRFAARVLWSVDTPYDYDVDYYSSFGNSAMNSYALCSASAFGAYYGRGFRPPIGGYTFLAQFSSWERLNYPYFSLCNSLFDRYQCYSWLTFSVFPSCLSRVARIARFPTDINGGGGIPGGGNGDPSDSLPGKGGIKDQLFPKAPETANGNGNRFDRMNDGTGLDGIMSIPTRATRKMKDDDARRERGSSATEASGSSFDRAGAENKTDKNATADAGSVQPPSREPTKAKATSRPREATRSRTGFGSTTRETGSRAGSSARDRDTRSRPAKASGSAGGTSVKPATSLGGTSTAGKKKPPEKQ